MTPEESKALSTLARQLRDAGLPVGQTEPPEQEYLADPGHAFSRRLDALMTRVLPRYERPWLERQQD